VHQEAQLQVQIIIIIIVFVVVVVCVCVYVCVHAVAFNRAISFLPHLSQSPADTAIMHMV
jgi:threonine/homoserine/homoserine lactone efflux protein